MMATHKRILGTLVAALALGGCASASGTAGDEPAATGGQTAVVIENRNSAVSSATVYLVPASGGARRVLGIVSFGEQRTFPVEVGGGSTNYRLVAESGGQPLTTRDFILREGDVVEWDMLSGAVRRRDQ